MSSVDSVPETVPDGMLEVESVDLESIVAGNEQLWRKEGEDEIPEGVGGSKMCAYVCRINMKHEHDKLVISEPSFGAYPLSRRLGIASGGRCC